MEMDQLLDQQPSILEITNHARTANWNQLGVQLELYNVDLAGCHDCTSMYQLWIMEKAENATRRNLLNALRAIRQNDTAQRYQHYLETLVARVSTQNTYERALEKGEIDVAYGRIMLLGTAGVGKTSLKRSLMKLPWKPDTPCTIISEVSCVRPFRNEWYNTSLEDDDKLILVTDEDEIDEMAKLFALDPSNTTSFLSSVTASTLYNVPSITKPNPSSVSKQSINLKVSEILSRAISKSEEISLKDLENIKPRPFLHIWDCGGQPVFLEILPAFLTPRTMFLLLFDASKNFMDRWQSVQDKNGQKIPGEEMNVTTLDLMLNWMSSIHGHLMRYNKVGGCCEYPRICCIGTHGDVLKTENERKEVVEKLESYYKDKQYFQLIDKTLIIDNTTSGKRKKEDPNLSVMRNVLCQFTCGKLMVKTPVSWILFRKVIQLFDANIIHLDEACDIGVDCKIPRDDVPKTLLFYHDLGVVLFFPHIEGLTDKVIIKPKWFVETLGKVFALDVGVANGKTRQMWELLQAKGILLEELYLTIWKECDLKPETIINLLVSLHLAVKCTNVKCIPKQFFNQPIEKYYFLPAMLKSFNDDSSKAPKDYFLRASPLHITFSTKFVPPGFFTRFVTSFASHSFCQLMFDDGIYRDRVIFTYGEAPIDRIILIDLHSAIQIDVLRYDEEDNANLPIDDVCQNLLTVLEVCVNQVYGVLTVSKDFLDKSFQPVSISWEFKYVCKECPEKTDRHYLVVNYIKSSNIRVRCERKWAFRSPTAEEAVWFKGRIKHEQIDKEVEDSSGTTKQVHVVSTQESNESREKRNTTAQNVQDMKDINAKNHAIIQQGGRNCNCHINICVGGWCAISIMSVIVAIVALILYFFLLFIKDLKDVY